MADDRIPLGNVSDTGRWVAFYRALESERRDALFHDPFARRLAGEQGEAIVRSMPLGRRVAWPMIVRTAVMDELLDRLIARGTVRCVLNLAAGLDARPFRMALPSTLRWIDADLPGILEYKRGVLEDARPACAYEAAAVDLRDPGARRELFARAAAAGPTVVLTEGLLIYLDDQDVRGLAQDLHRAESFRWWIIDLASPLMLKRIGGRWNRKLSAANAAFRFAPAEGTAFFAPLGWREVEFRSIWMEAKRLRRAPWFAWIYGLLGAFMPPARRQALQRMSGIVLFERS